MYNDAVDSLVAAVRYSDYGPEKNGDDLVGSHKLYTKFVLRTKRMIRLRGLAAKRPVRRSVKLCKRRLLNGEKFLSSLGTLPPIKGA